MEGGTGKKAVLIINNSQPVDDEQGQIRNNDKRLFLRLCDMRRAVIVVNGIQIGLCVFILCNLLFWIRHMEWHINNSGEHAQLYRQVVPAMKVKALWKLLGLAIHVGAIAGALSYNKYLVGLQALQGIRALLYQLISFGSLPFLNQGYFRIYFECALLIVGLCLFSIYPNVILAYQIHKGIMSKETYHRQDYYICQSMTQQPTQPQQQTVPEVV